MYLGFYGFAKEPFNITPDPEFLYFSPSHKEAFAAVTYGVANRKGFVVLTGEIGTGKTTILRTYLDRIDRNAVECIYLFDPNLSFSDLLELLLREMGHEVTQREAAWMIQWLHWSLVRRFQAGRNVAVIIDEAQNMPVETIEQLRVLSNLETTKEKLLQIVLVGQPELNKKLDLESLRQLKQRIAVRATLMPLTRAESLDYLRHRVEQAGGKLDEVFAPAALKAMVRYAKGIPRKLNIVASNALLAGYGGQRRPVTVRVVREVIADLEGSWGRPWLRRTLGACAALTVAACAIVALLQLAPPDLASHEPPTQPLQTTSLPDTENVRVALEAMSKVLTAAPPITSTPSPPSAVAVETPAKEAPPTETPTVVAAHDETPEPSPEKPAEAPANEKTTPPETAPPDEGGKQEPAETAKPASAEPAAAESASVRATRIVKPGECLTKMIKEVYGTSNRKVLDAVLKRNPQIKDPNIVLAGNTIVFPEIDPAKPAE